MPRSVAGTTLAAFTAEGRHASDLELDREELSQSPRPQQVPSQAPKIENTDKQKGRETKCKKVKR